MLRLIFLIISLVSFNSFAQFSSEDQVSLVQTGGNTNVKTYLAKSINSYKLDKNVF